MNILSKYDIADVVSHISGSTRASDPGASEASSFASLFAKAIESVPDSKAEGKVAESGKNLPDSATAGKQIDGNGKLTNSLDQNLQSEGGPNRALAMALFSPFYRGQGFSPLSELVSQEKIDNGISESKNLSEVSEALNSLKSSSGIDLENKESVDQGKIEKLLNLPENELENSDQLVRVTTLRHKRPVILGPGQFIGDKLQSEALVNHFPDYFVDNSNSLKTPDLREEVNTSLPSLGRTGRESDGADNAITVSSKIKSHIDEFEKLGNDFDLSSQKREESLGSLELANSDKTLKGLETDNVESNNVLAPGTAGLGKADINDGRINNLTAVSPKVEENTDTDKIFGNEINFRPNRIEEIDEGRDVLTKVNDHKTDALVAADVIGKSDKRKNDSSPNIKGLSMETGSTNKQPVRSLKDDGSVISPNARLQAQEFKKFETARMPSTTDKNLSGEVQNLTHSNSASAAETKGSSISNNEILSSVSKIPGDPQNSQQLGDSSGKEHAVPYTVNRNRNSVSKEHDGVVEGSQVRSYELKNVSKRDSMGSEIKDALEILINNDKKAIKTGPARAASNRHDLTLQDVDSSANVAKNDTAESSREPFAASQVERTPVPNRSEILPRSVSVSNFNSEIRETIVGQLTNSSKGLSKFTVALFPENFGKISIEISYSENTGLKINMIGDNPEATRILEQNLPSLRENLQSEKLSELIVNLNSNRDFHSSNNRNGKSENENSGENAGKEPPSSESDESGSVTNKRGLALDSDNSLDTYV